MSRIELKPRSLLGYRSKDICQVLQVHFLDERLRKVAAPVKEVNADIQRTWMIAFETMYAEEGIGLAATQVDIHQRIIVIDVSAENRDQRPVLIN